LAVSTPSARCSDACGSPPAARAISEKVRFPAPMALRTARAWDSGGNSAARDRSPLTSNADVASGMTSAR
jgi:hypothetical protein